MNDSDLELFFHPRSIAIVGVSQDFSTIGGKPMKSLIRHGYKGKIYPVNPKYEEVAGYPCYPSILDVPDSVDVALVAISNTRAMKVLQDCAAKNVKFVMLFGSGFAEIGPEGENLQQELLQVAKKAGIRVIGPNCIGSINVKDRIPMGFTTYFESDHLLAGPVGLVSQSGAFGYFVFGALQQEYIGAAYVATTGNQMDLTALDFLSFMLEDKDTKIAAGYIESLPDEGEFVRLAQRARTLHKPLILLKAGRSELGRKAALFHTGSVTGSYAQFQKLCQKHGVIDVNTEDELIDTIKVFSRGKIPSGDRLAIVTASGAAGIMMADHCDALGLKISELSDRTRDQVKAVLPSFGSSLNPIDITAQAINNRDIFHRVFEALVHAEEVDMIVVMIQFGRDQLKSMCRELASIEAKTSKPVVVTLSGSNEVVGEGREILLSSGIPVYDSSYRTALALSRLAQYSRF